MSWRSAVLLLLLGFAVGAMVFFLVKGGLLGLPTSPFGGERPEISILEEAGQAERRIARRFPSLVLDRLGVRSEPQLLNVRLHESDLRDLALAGLMRHPEGPRVLAMIEQVHAEIGDGEVGLALVVDLEAIPRDSLSAGELDTLEKIEKTLPLLGDSLPIGVYGRPEVRSGRLRFGEDARFVVSILKLSLTTVSDRLGISERELEDSLEIEWPGYEVLEVTVEEGVLDLVVRSA